MTRETFRDYDPANYIKTAADVAAYLKVAAESGDAAHFASALGDVARARNMSEVARNVGLSRKGLYKALSADGNPTLATTMRVMATLGMQISVQPTPAPKKKQRARATARA